MKKFVTRLFAVVISAIMCISFASCKKRDRGTDEEIDESKIQLYVYNYNGGYGTDWLYAAKNEFEKLVPYAQIVVDPVKATAPLDSNAIKTNDRDQLYFSEGVQYLNLKADDVIEDISEAVTTPNEFDGGKILKDKLTAQQQEFYDVEGKYYGLPHYAGYFGFIYNKKMFDDNGWYFKKDLPANLNADYDDDFIHYSQDKTKSAGPNGVYGDFDDGLPATYEQFFILLKYISGTKAVTWTNKYNIQYVGYTLNALTTDYEGLDNMIMNYTFNGVANDLGTIQHGDFVFDEQPTTITADNGYELQRQAGKYYAIDFMDRIIANSTFYDKTYVHGTDEQTAAQDRFIRGEAAILMEGVWWESEAEDGEIFSDYNPSKDKYDYDFAWMPLPKQSEEKLLSDKQRMLDGGKSFTLYDHLNSICILKKGLSKEVRDLAIKFIKFVYSDEWLVKFTQYTSALKALNYDIPDEKIQGLTSYAKSLIEYVRNSDVVYPYSRHAIYVQHPTEFDAKNYYKTKFNGTGFVDSGYGYENPVAMMINSDVHNAEQYFDGMYKYSKENWWN